MFYSKEIFIGERMVGQFADLTGDKNRIHLDAEYAATTKFKRPIVHGMFVSSFISPCLVEAFGDGTIYAGQSLQFLKPVYVDDTILVEFTDLVKLTGKSILHVKTSIFTVVNSIKVHHVIAGQAAFMPAKHTIENFGAMK